jgi:hypothetical protein
VGGIPPALQILGEISSNFFESTPPVVELLMDYKLRLLGYCGLYCGACNHYRSSFPESKHLLEEKIKQGEDPHSYSCRGCRGELEYMHAGCDVCDIKSCSVEKGLEHCGLCSSFPCEKIIEFQHDDRYIHHLDVIDNLNELNEKGSEQWLKEQQKKWTCDCGMHFSWYETNCSSCGADLMTYATDLRQK